MLSYILYWGQIGLAASFILMYLSVIFTFEENRVISVGSIWSELTLLAAFEAGCFFANSYFFDEVSHYIAWAKQDSQYVSLDGTYR